MNSDDARFGGLQRLFGQDAGPKLRQAHVCVIGLGGVGSWGVEALARSGIGTLTLVDLDDICVTNVNRQLHAIEGEIGHPKVDAMTRRVKAIQPNCVVHPRHAFFTAATAAELIGTGFDYVLDAIDDPDHKSLLITLCRAKGIPVMVVGGAGGRQNATSLRIADLAFSTHDPLLRQVRSQLRKNHGFPPGETPFGVDCVFLPERVVFPREDGTVGERCESRTSLRLDCESGYGTACFVTGAFGFAAAGHIVRQLAQGETGSSQPQIQETSGSERC